MSRNFIEAQRTVNQLYREWPGLRWAGVASRMWTGNEELASYRERFDVDHPLAIDATNETVLRHEIRQFPTLLVLRNGKKLLRIDDFGDPEEVSRRFRRVVSGSAVRRDSG